MVLARQVDPGQTVASSFNTPTLFVLAQDLTQMKLEVAIDEADVGSVQLGQKANFTVDAFPGRTFPATITRVDLGSNLTVSSATASSSTTSATATTGQVVSYAADLTVANPSLELRPGMTATADIVTSAKQNVLLVPNAALRFKTADPAAGTNQGGGIAGSLTFRPRRGGQPERTATAGRGAQQTIYVKGADGKPQAVKVVTGDTNGQLTEVIGGDLKPGQQVITGQLANGDGSSSGSSRRSGGGGQRRQGGGGG